ncbi:hypothetical protein HYH03_013817 [Edaphochlamys debaryana]|uniref:Uncharacterized protein n=1 Tax=Edaphochlamys debaryana TaxID=47281 RepID=A0A835XQ67_9CHLO|nr:hypothetical protein HYH03_013817 [Edaphochlamys debaryana]|eukprot:KAG2487537.1 hypothetical protein HYH03_013817 [Edaphochlamys debaryana]
MDAESDVWIGTEDNNLLWPVGGEIAAGLGRRNHTAWLEAFGRAGVPCLTLDHIALSHQDLRTLSAHTGLKQLHFDKGTQYPCKGLLLLPRSPALELLMLDVGEWCGPGCEGPFEPPADVETVLQAVLCANPRLNIELSCTMQVAEEVAEQVYDLGMDVEAELLIMGDPAPSRLEVELEVKAEEEEDEGD